MAKEPKPPYATGPNGQKYATKEEYDNARMGYQLSAQKRRKNILGIPGGGTA